MNSWEDRWLYYVDDEVIHSLLQAEPSMMDGVPGMKERALSSPAVVQAVSLFLEGRKAEAISRLEKAIAEADTEADAYSFLGGFYLEAQRFDQAAPVFEQALERNPRSRCDLYNLGICRYKQERWAEAAEMFRQASDLAPRAARTESLVAQGVCFLHENEAQGALELFEQALMVNPKQPQARFGKGVALQMQRRRDEADAIYQELELENPDSPDLLLNRLSIALSFGNEVKIRDLAERLQASNRPILTLAAHEALATLAFVRERFAEAVKHCEKLTELAPGSAEGWFNLGVARQQINQVRPAIEAYLQAVEIDPTLKQAYANLGFLHHRRGDWEAARAAYIEALQRDPHLAEALWNLAILLEQQGHEGEAAVCFEQLTQLVPNWEEPWFRLATNHLTASRWDASVSALEACLELRADWVEAANGLALAKAKLGDYEAARVVLERVLSIDPKPQVLFNLGVLHQQTGHAETAVRYYREALEQKPDFAEAFLNLGHALKEMGQAQAAQESWRRAVRLRPAYAAEYFA